MIRQGSRLITNVTKREIAVCCRGVIHHRTRNGLVARSSWVEGLGQVLIAEDLMEGLTLFRRAGGVPRIAWKC